MLLVIFPSTTGYLEQLPHMTLQLHQREHIAPVRGQRSHIPGNLPYSRMVPKMDMFTIILSFVEPRDRLLPQSKIEMLYFLADRSRRAGKSLALYPLPAFNICKENILIPIFKHRMEHT